MTLLFVLLALLHARVLGLSVRAANTARFLRREAPARGRPLPRVSIIAPARNEEAMVEHAARSLLALDYPDLEIILINDRSTDATGAILDRLAAEFPRLRVLHIEKLPADWLGKNHALERGRRLATGEFVLFTDADIVMAPSTIRRAVGVCMREGLDHLAAAPCMPRTTWLLDASVTAFGVMFALALRPWKVGRPDDPAFAGVGAFNFVRRTALEAIGGLRRIRLRPDEDIRLGQLLKWSGHRQAAMFGNGLISVEWYPNLPAMIRGMEKNAFAGLDYRIVQTSLAAGFLLAFAWLPFAGLLAEGPVRVLAALALVMMYAAAGILSARARRPLSTVAGYPLGLTVLAAILVNSMHRTILDRGIRWRGTHYPLARLCRFRTGRIMPPKPGPGSRFRLASGVPESYSPH